MTAASKLLAISGLLCCSLAHADLYTGHIASLEWKTHSADLVLLVSVQPTSTGEFVTKLTDQFVRDGDDASDAVSLATAWIPPRQYSYQHDWKPHGDWLLFVRRWRDKEPTVDHTVYLENTRQASWMSAITTDGETIEKRQDVLAVVRKRLADGQPMTERQRDARRLVDKGKQLSTRQLRRPGPPEKIAPWLGGFQIPTDIDLWDSPPDNRSFNESLWVNYMTVPADDAYRMVLLEYWNKYVRMDHDERRRLTGGYPLGALVNYPGEQTEELLERLMAIQQHQHFGSNKNPLPLFS